MYSLLENAIVEIFAITFQSVIESVIFQVGRANADKSMKNGRILCLVFTDPTRHATHAKAVFETWGPQFGDVFNFARSLLKYSFRCDGILFVSTANDFTLPVAVFPPESMATDWETWTFEYFCTIIPESSHSCRSLIKFLWLNYVAELYEWFVFRCVRNFTLSALLC